MNSPAPALSRGLKILELINEHGEMSFGELQDKSGINTSSLHRIIKVLLYEGYIQKSNNANYNLGLKSFILSGSESFWNLLISRARHVLKDISEKFNVTVPLYGYSNKEIIVLDKVIHPDNVALRPVGKAKRDYLLSPWGYLYLADLDQDDRQKFINKVKNEEWSDLVPPSFVDLNRMVNLARNNGYADDEGKILQGIRRLAAPVYDTNGSLIAALGAGSFASLLSEKDSEEIGLYLKRKAKDVSLY